MATKCAACEGQGRAPLMGDEPEHEWKPCKVCHGVGMIAEKGDVTVPVKDDPYDEEEAYTDDEDISEQSPREVSADVGGKRKSRARRRA